MKRKSQSSLEYLLILAFAMGILIPAIYVFYSYSSNSREQLTDSIVMQIGSEIIENSKFVHYSGEGSWITLNVDLPSNVNKIYVTGNRELVFDVQYNDRESQVVFFSNVVDLYTNDPSDCYELSQKGVVECYIARGDAEGKMKIRIGSLEGKGVVLSKG